MSLQQYVRQVRPRNESYIPPVDKIQNFLSEAYTFFPTSEEEISNTLADWAHENVADVIFEKKNSGKLIVLLIF